MSVTQFILDPQQMMIVVVSVLFSIGALLAWRAYHKPALLYAHLLLVLSPLFYIALSVNCSVKIVNTALAWCSLAFAKAILYLLPVTLAGTFIAGFAILPLLYRKMAKPMASRAFDTLCTKTGIRASLFAIDNAKPSAFTIGNCVFVSVGMFELLSAKELEAVFLHELHHVRARAAFGKFSAGFVRAFSPIAWFSSHSVEREEIEADGFAAQVQKTSKYLKSAQTLVRF